jgi:hypothetical protein
VETPDAKFRVFDEPKTVPPRVGFVADGVVAA